MQQLLTLLNALLDQTGAAHFSFGNLVMIAVGSTMIYLAVVKHYEPLLLIGIGFACIVDMTTEDHVAAISAAVYATIGSHRIVRIEEAQHGLGWVLAGRAAHHAGRPVPHSLRS
jgi:Na+-transporting methylmalonyl-CoA/oxaloacetate decarboxylase beta subunit